MRVGALVAAAGVPAVAAMSSGGGGGGPFPGRPVPGSEEPGSTPGDLASCVVSKRIVAVVLVALIAGGLGGALLFAVLGGGDDGGEVAGPETTTTTTKPLNAVAKELVDRLADARERDLHLVYSGALPAGEEGRLAVEVWWKSGRARQSLVVEVPGRGRTESTAFVLGDGNVFCQRTDATPWSCQKGASTATADGAAAGIIDALVSSLEGKDVTSEDAEVGDEDAECYTLDPATGDVLCLRDDDVPVRFTFSGAELTLASVETEVNDQAFEPPAEVQPGVSAPTTPTSGG